MLGEATRREVRAPLAGATTLPPPSVAEASVCVATFLTEFTTACPMLWVGALLIGALALLTLCVTAFVDRGDSVGGWLRGRFAERSDGDGGTRRGGPRSLIENVPMTGTTP